jgi:hypothetical protein
VREKMTDATTATTAQPGCRTTTAVADSSPSYGDFVGGRAVLTSAKTAAVSAAADSAIRGGGSFGSSTSSLARPQTPAPALLQQHGDSSGVLAAALWCSFSSSSC